VASDSLPARAWAGFLRFARSIGPALRIAGAFLALAALGAGYLIARRVLRGGDGHTPGTGGIEDSKRAVDKGRAALGNALDILRRARARSGA